MDWHRKQKWAADLRRAKKANLPKPPPAVNPKLVQVLANWGYGARHAKKPKIIGNTVKVNDLWMIPEVPEAEPNKPFTSARNYGAWLMKKGWQRLGSGAHSVVYGRDGSDKVIKVTSSLDNWIDYVQWAATAGYAGNLAPRVYSWKRHTGNNDYGFAVAVVERMAKGGYDEDPKDDGSLLYGLTRYARKGNVRAQTIMELIQPGSVRFFKQLSELKFDGDVGGNNIMYRKDGSLCLTDPCAGRIKTTAKRLRSGDLSPSLYGYYYEDCEFQYC